jgi:TolB-like protein
MNRRTMMAALLACGALGGCARYYYGEHAVRDPADLVVLHHGAADALLQQVALDPAQPVLVATVVQLDRLDASSRLGRLVSEQVAGRLAQRGLRVTELRLRETHQVAQAQAAQAVLVGTYAVAPQAVYVSLRLVGPQGNAVLAAHDYALPMDGNVRGLLVESY